jgi:hypothetical protein
MLRTLSRAATVVATVTTALTAVSGVAAAAPQSKGATTVTPSSLTSSVLQGLTGPASLSSTGAVFGITGNPSSGVIKHVGGLRLAELNPATPATSLTLSNLWIDAAKGTVSALVDDGARVTVLTVGSGGVLSFTDAASRAVTGTSALTGAVAGTATIALR